MIYINYVFIVSLINKAFIQLDLAGCFSLLIYTSKLRINSWYKYCNG